ncbi:aminotransferase class I/II-fold pyridoxal phosphate-dependent enzyme, partial [bacterium]|nr:aminotransferase class I/II-fold pyridoxal phosphate-dependent enzyme [candidate division CSSED10-310 bacterium]
PFNPTGYMPTREEAFRMRDILVAAADSRRSPLVVVLDDAYEGFVMSEEALPCSLFNLLVDAHPNLIPIKVDGISKEFLWWGGRVAFLTMGLHSQHLSSAAVSPTTVAKRRDELSALFEYKAGAVIRSTISNTNRPVQEALLRVMQSRERLDGALAERAAFIEILARRINLFKQLLSTLDSRLIQPDPFNAGFFLFLNLAPELSAQEFARIMLDSYKVGVVPFEDSARGINGLRITFASIPSAHIERVVQAIAMTLKNLEIQHKTNK